MIDRAILEIEGELGSYCRQIESNKANTDEQFAANFIPFAKIEHDKETIDTNLEENAIGGSVFDLIIDAKRKTFFLKL